MASDKQQPNPWIAKSHFDALHKRCDDAEACLRRVLDFINPELLTEHAGDWKAATEAICNE